MIIWTTYLAEKLKSLRPLCSKSALSENSRLPQTQLPSRFILWDVQQANRICCEAFAAYFRNEVLETDSCPRATDPTLQPFRSSRALSFPISSWLTRANLVALHAIEQLLHRYRVRRFVPLRDDHRPGRCDTAEQRRHYEVIRKQIPGNQRAARQQVHPLKK